MSRRVALSAIRYGPVLGLLVCIPFKTARANTITQPISLVDQLFGAVAVAFQQFNPAWGTLNSIQINLNATTVTILEHLTTGATTGSFKIQSRATTIAVKNGSNQVMDQEGPTTSAYVYQTVSTPYTTVDRTNTFSLAAASTTYSAPTGARTAGPTTSASSITVGLLEGTSTVLLTFASSFTPYYLGPSGASASFEDKGTITGSLIYDYTPAPPPSIPEPVTLALFGSGLVLMGWMGRKRLNR